jgi:ribonuclease T1
MPTIRHQCARVLLTALLHLMLFVLSLALCGCSLLPSPPISASAPTARVTPTASATALSAMRPSPLRAQPIEGFDTITPDQLPPQARQTLALIAQGGPFPYRQDGQVFQNRERRLPRHPSGYYHEYTVETPGSDDRGARRIITGAAGEIFFTGDHYASFVQVLAQ